MANHLAGAVAARTALPVIGVPLSGSEAARGWTPCIRPCRCPRACPSRPWPIDGAVNAAILAAQISARPGPGGPAGCTSSRTSRRRRSRVDAGVIPRYTLPEMARRLVRGDASSTHWLRIEVLACEGWARLGRIPQEDVADDPGEGGRADARARRGDRTRSRNHDVAAFVQAAAEPIGPAGALDPLRADVERPAGHRAGAADARGAGPAPGTGSSGCSAVVRRRALEHRDTICVGRTHGVHAEPTTFGHKLALWAFELDRDRDRLRRAREAVSVGKLSGRRRDVLAGRSPRRGVRVRRAGPARPPRRRAR